MLCDPPAVTEATLEAIFEGIEASILSPSPLPPIMYRSPVAVIYRLLSSPAAMVFLAACAMDAVRAVDAACAVGTVGVVGVAGVVGAAVNAATAKVSVGRVRVRNRSVFFIEDMMFMIVVLCCVV
jgi:hypothetical protein